MSKQWMFAVLFVCGTGLMWGTYIPSIHKAAVSLQSNLRAFLLVGLAYFLVAVLVPVALMYLLNWDPTVKANPNWGSHGVRWGLFAGTLGALGALCIVFGVVTAPNKMGPLIVPPLVFTMAPIVSTFVTFRYFQAGRLGTPDWRFFLGLAMAIGGTVLVMIYKPSPAKTPAAGQQEAAQVSTVATEGAGSS